MTLAAGGVQTTWDLWCVSWGVSGGGKRGGVRGRLLEDRISII